MSPSLSTINPLANIWSPEPLASISSLAPEPERVILIAEPEPEPSTTSQSSLPVLFIVIVFVVLAPSSVTSWRVGVHHPPPIQNSNHVSSDFTLTTFHACHT